MKTNPLKTVIALSMISFFWFSCNRNLENQFESDLQLKSATQPVTKKYSSEVVTSWYVLLTDIVRSTPYPPPPSLRIFAYSGLSLYESVLPGMPSHKSLYKNYTGQSLSWEGPKSDFYAPAAANAAMARIASKMISQYTPSASLAAVQALELKYNTQFAEDASAEQLALSAAYGKLVADAVFDWSKLDGTFTATGGPAPCPPYVPLGQPGNWKPTPPGYFPAAGACQGNLRTFLPNIVTSVLPPPPPVYSTLPGSAYYNTMQEVYTNRLNATPEDIQYGLEWRDHVGVNLATPAHMVRLTATIVRKENLDLENASVLFAKTGIALFDAVASAFYAKFHYNSERPITYIWDVMGETSWSSQYPTLQHPAYPSTTGSASAASVEVLESYFGTSYNFIDSTQRGYSGVPYHSYTSFAQLLQGVNRSRTHSGLNYKEAMQEANKLGRSVGNRVGTALFK